MAWEHFFKEDVPEMFLWLQDRDIFENKYEESKYFYYYINSKPYSFESWLNIYEKLKKKEEREKILNVGKQIYEYYNIQKDLIIKHHAIPLKIKEVKGWIINTNRLFATEIGNELSSKNNSFTLVWSFSNKGKIACSVRSVEESLLSAIEIAEMFGGGGHKHAAKFNMGIEDFHKNFL